MCRYPPPKLTDSLTTLEIFFDFGKVNIIDNIVIAEMNEGITFDLPDRSVLLKYCQEYFNEKPFGFISHRINSYAINPTVYIDAAKNFNVKAVAIVAVDTISRGNVAIEKQFFGDPFEIFDNLEYAINWMKQMLLTE